MSKYGLLFLSLLFSSALQADAIEIIGETPAKIINNNQGKSVAAPKTILLQKIKLSSDAKLVLKARINDLQTYGNQIYKTTASLPLRVNLGMNKTPVLDQGQHGTCVTFAITGAIDATLGKGDYVSQLCSLELANYLVNIKKPPYPYSGWNGSWGTYVRNLLLNYGIVSKAYQLKYGCPQNVKQYPILNSSITSKSMTIAAYTAVSSALPSSVVTSVLADSNSTFSSSYNPSTTLMKIKQSLAAGKRVTIGFLLDENQGNAGAVGTKSTRYDTWVTNSSILNKAKTGTLNAGHEIIVIGYDDTATARGNDGKISKGLLILMNSWGPYAGNKGIYYMSYDYLLYLADEAMIVGHK